MTKSSEPILKDGYYVLSKEEANKQDYLYGELERKLYRIKERFWELKIHAIRCDEIVKNYELECADLNKSYYDERIKKAEQLNECLERLLKDLPEKLEMCSKL
jgi:hypothetical protein